MFSFKDWMSQAAFIEVAIVDRILSILTEKTWLRQTASTKDDNTLWGTEDSPEADRNLSVCPKTPLSSYQREIGVIQNFALSNPENFAQVLMFSPLSAHAPFAKHWDNFAVLMMILKQYFPKKVNKEELEKIIDGFGDKYYALSHTIGGWKFKTIEHIWNNREDLFQKLVQAHKSGNEEALLGELVKIPGVQPIKAGFAAQLIFGRHGCLDVHNIDIYSKVFPDLKNDLDDKLWNTPRDPSIGIKKYLKLLNKLKERGIGTQELWDVWVDFVGKMYKMINSGGGQYLEIEPALNPHDPKYDDLKTTINKYKITAKGNKTDKIVQVPTITGGPEGGGAGLTHTIAAKEPGETLQQFNRLARGEDAENWAKAVPKLVDPRTGLPFDKLSGGDKPAAYHYFGQAIDDKGNVDYDRIKDIIRQRAATGGKKARSARASAAQGNLF